MKSFLQKYREIIAYLFFGVVTTVVSMGVYFTILLLTEHLGKISPDDAKFNAVRLVAQILQWICGVIVAFVTNKKWVFNAGNTDKRKTMSELSRFAAGRLGTLGLDTVLTFGTVWILGALKYVPFTLVIPFTADLWSKIVSSVAVIVANYVISKFIVFKKA